LHTLLKLTGQVASSLPLSSQTLMDLTNKTLSELKDLAAELGVNPDGHRGHKQSWIRAIESANCDRHSGCFTDDRPPNRGEERGGRVEIEAIENSPGVKTDPSPAESGITLSPRFLTLYTPPSTQKQFVPDETGQLSLLNFTEEEEPPDSDDFEGDMFAFWAACDAWCDRNPDDYSEQCTEADLQCTEADLQCTEADLQCTEADLQCTGLIELSLASMCEWAPCPDEWYEPIEIIETTSSTLEDSPVSDSSSMLDRPKFSIPVFADRNSEDPPPTAGSFARLPPTGLKGFPPARAKVSSSGRAPPGGDAM
jgi:hypothetical protein